MPPSPTHDANPSDPDHPDATPSATAPGPVVLRIPASAYAAVLCLTVILVVPVANWPAYTGWLMLVPVYLVWWIARVRTTITTESVAVRTAFGRRTVRWAAVRGVVFPHPRIFGITWARAHLRDGTVLRLPAVTWNDIPRVSRASGRRIPDPLVPRVGGSTERIDSLRDVTDDTGTTDRTDRDDAADDGPRG